MTSVLGTDELKKRMEPTHIEGISELDLLKEKVEAKENVERPDEKKEPDLTEDPKAKETYTFKFNWADPRGKKWVGNFTAKPLTVREESQAGVMRAQLNHHAPIESLDALTDEINFILSRLSYSLTEKPDWFKDPMSLMAGVELIQAVFKEVAAYQAFFREHGKVESDS